MDPTHLKKVNKEYSRYKIPKSESKKTLEDICFPKKIKLQPPQLFLPEYIKKNPNKGLLIYHKPGSGKTLTAILIAEKMKNKKNIIFVAPASLISNFRNELRSPLVGESYITLKERDILKKHHPSTKEYKQIIKFSDERIDSYYQIFSYNKFTELLENKQLSLKNTLLIIDEIQNIISEKGYFYNTIYNNVMKSPSTSVIALTGTPIYDKPEELPLLFNLLKIPLQLSTGKEFHKQFISPNGLNAINLDVLKSLTYGYVSYFRGANPIAFPELKLKYVKCEMSSFQYKSYITVLENENKNNSNRKGFDKGQIRKLHNDFLLGTRIISNIAYPNKNINEAGFNKFVGRFLNINNLEKYSTKFFQIIKRLNKLSGTAFVYSNFKEYGGLKSFSKVLEAFGYQDYSEHGEGKKRYAMYTGDETLQFRDELKNVFNNPNNLNGTKLKVLLLSRAATEGLSLMRCRQAHIMEPQWNPATMEQIIGRSKRLCSHKDLDPEKRYVKVYIYAAVRENDPMTVDQYLLKLAIKKKKLNEQFENALQESAIDCKLFINGNAFENDIKCDV